MSAPLVTVTMPAYRAMPWLIRAVESLLCQTLPDFRLIVILDGPCPDSRAYLQSVSNPRLEVIEKPHTGYVDTCNTGLNLCESPYLAMADSDDINCPERLAKQVELLERNRDIVGASANCVYFVKEGDSCGTSQVFTDSDQVARDFFRLGAGFVTCAALYRTEALRSVGGFREAGEFREGMVVARDSDLILRLLEKYNLGNCADTLLWKRLVPDSTTNSDLLGNRLSHFFALECSTARRMNTKEPSLEEFLALRQCRHPIRKFRDWSDCWSVISYQKGLYARGRELYVRSLFWKIVAVFLSPRRLLRRFLIWYHR